MKKFIMGLALAIATSSVAFAQTEKKNTESCNDCKKTEQTTCSCDKKEDCKDKKECCKEGKKGRKGNKHFKGNKGRKGGAGFNGAARGGQRPQITKLSESRVFEGITLTEAQKNKLDALRGDVKGDRKNAGQMSQEERKKALEEAKKKAEEARAKFNKEVKAILTPEQYKQYEENIAKRAKK